MSKYQMLYEEMMKKTEENLVMNHCLGGAIMKRVQ